jgi:lysine 6-dehydrogenase
MRIAVIGAGLMGRAAVYDLGHNDEVEQIGVFDIDAKLAGEVAEAFGERKALADQLDAGDEDAVAKALDGFDAALSAVTYRYNPGITRAAIQSGCHLVDLGGNNDTVKAQIELNAEAEAAGVIAIPDCGLAPGMVSVLTADGIARLDSTSAVRIRVGGLPQSPRPPLNYQMVFSPEGLINEYWEPCVILDGGQKKTVRPMTAIESLEFDGIGQLEAFYTSGGTSTLPDTYRGQVDFLDYKTIRYPGHCEAFRPMLDIGLGSFSSIDVDGQKVVPRSVLKAILQKNLSFGEPDLVLVRVTVEGKQGGADKTIVYEIIDRQDRSTGLTAMMRTTSFPATIIAWMAAAGHITERGVKPQEAVVPPAVFIPQLKKRGITLNIREE